MAQVMRPGFRHEFRPRRGLLIQNLQRSFTLKRPVPVSPENTHRTEPRKIVRAQVAGSRRCPWGSLSLRGKRPGAVTLPRKPVGGEYPMAPGPRSHPAMSASLPPLRIYQRGGAVQPDREHVLVLRQR